MSIDGIPLEVFDFREQRTQRLVLLPHVGLAFDLDSGAQVDIEGSDVRLAKLACNAMREAFWPSSRDAELDYLVESERAECARACKSVLDEIDHELVGSTDIQAGADRCLRAIEARRRDT